MDCPQAAIGDPKAGPAPARNPDFLDRDSDDFDFKIGVREDSHNADQVVEYVQKLAAFGTAPGREVMAIGLQSPDDPSMKDDRLYDADAMLGQ